MQVELDSGIVVEHLEPDGVGTAQEFLVGLHLDVEMVIEQVIVGAIAAIFAAEDVGPIRGGLRGLAGGHGGTESKESEGSHGIQDNSAAGHTGTVRHVVAGEWQEWSEHNMGGHGRRNAR